MAFETAGPATASAATSRRLLACCQPSRRGAGQDGPGGAVLERAGAYKPAGHKSHSYQAALWVRRREGTHVGKVVRGMKQGIKCNLLVCAFLSPDSSPGSPPVL